MGCLEIAPEPISKLEMFFDSDFQSRNLQILSSSRRPSCHFWKLENGSTPNSIQNTYSRFISHQTRVATSTNKTFNLYRCLIPKHTLKNISTTTHPSTHHQTQTHLKAQLFLNAKLRQQWQSGSTKGVTRLRAGRMIFKATTPRKR